MKNELQSDWAETVVLVDADYADRLVFDFSVQMERILERQMPKVQLPDWLDYMSLDGGLRPGENQIQVLLVYSKEKNRLKNILPSRLETELNGRAFKDNLGEFKLASFPVEKQVVLRGKLMCQSVAALLASEKVERLLLVADLDEYQTELKEVLSDLHKKEVTLFVLNPVSGFHCGQEIITYSLMAALGVKGEELS